jgi:hypothetical protein
MYLSDFSLKKFWRKEKSGPTRKNSYEVGGADELLWAVRLNLLDTGRRKGV